MEPRIAAWQRTAIRENMARYRRTQEDYSVLGKPVVVLEDRGRVFSLVSPPLDSPAARRRVRLLMNDNMAAVHAAAARGGGGALGSLRERPLAAIWRDMIASPLYATPSARCRLSKREFWDRLAAPAVAPAPAATL